MGLGSYGLLGRLAMVTVDKQSVGDLLLMDVLADLHRVKRKLEQFARKYGSDVDAFEERIKTEDESFERYDDLIEWKAYRETFNQLCERIEELKHGRFQVA
jgi:hypothetical protein